MTTTLPTFSPAVSLALRLATEAGELISSIEPNVGEIEEKDDVNVGHHAIVTTADPASQRHIVNGIWNAFPNARVLAEERPDREGDERIVTLKNLESLLRARLVFGVDPLDGSSSYGSGHYEWSVSIGPMEYGVHTGGAIVAPKVHGGLTVVGERGAGVWIKKNGVITRVRIGNPTKKKDVMAYIGPDIFMMDRFSRFVSIFSKNIRTTNANGSCALGLANLLNGAAALIQPVQGPWDWFAGFPLVEEAGGKVQFYQYDETGIIPLDKPDLASYDPVVRRVAFIAGVPWVVNWLFELLQKEWFTNEDLAAIDKLLKERRAKK